MKILVVDDSIVFRSAIVSVLGESHGIEIVRSLSNGQLAVDFLAKNSDIDLITLDMEMPILDGMETIKEIRKFNKKVVIILFSSHTQKGAKKTFEALNAGANDFVAKPDSSSKSQNDGSTFIKNELLPKILAFKERTDKILKSFSSDLVQNYTISSDLKCKFRPNLIAIGCSTGGPEALANVFKNIKVKLNIPIVVVQHMPPLFTQKLAEMLCRLSPIEVCEAKDGDKLLPGVCYIAPGDYHMTIDANNMVHLDQNEKVCYVRPSVDVLFNSLAENFRGNILSIILTGMGEDGAAGAKNLNKKGAQVVVQDKESSVVWGMPGAVKKLVEEARIVSLDDIGKLIEMNSN